MTEDKPDILLKRMQVTIAILAGLATLILGVWNIRKSVLSAGKGDIKAAIVSTAGAPIADARVDLYSAENALLNAGDAGADGQYTRKVEAGMYVLKISKQGFEPEVVTVSVEAKQDTEVKIRMAPLAGNTAAGKSGIQAALEDVGASWIKKIGTAKSETEAKPS